jgi:hypothetical protein
LNAHPEEIYEKLMGEFKKLKSFYPLSLCEESSAAQC